MPQVLVQMKLPSGGISMRWISHVGHAGHLFPSRGKVAPVAGAAFPECGRQRPIASRSRSSGPVKGVYAGAQSHGAVHTARR